MFVKIKYEPGDQKPNIFPLDDNATINDLKIKLETIIEIPAESQVIRTQTTLIDNVVALSTMEQQQNNGIDISLYCDQKLICFLQLYNETEGDIQRNCFDQEKAWKGTVVPNPPESVVEKDFPPYVSVNAEQRQFILIITKDLTKKNFSDLMYHFFVLFGSSKNCDRFSFTKKDSVTEYDEKFWLTCGDRITCDWITESLCSLSGYKSYDFIEYFLLKRCTFILPEVVANYDILSVFQLLEVQNCGLCTDKWCVMERKSVLATSEDYKDKVVTKIYQNEEITLGIDTESIEFMQKNNFQLKYCSWSLSFNLIAE